MNKFFLLSFLLFFLSANAQQTPQQRLESEMNYRMNYGSVKEAIQKGANAHYRNEKGETVLHYVVQSSYGYTKESIAGMIDFLKEKGLSLNVTDNDGATPLHWAANKGYDDAIRVLIEKGAYVNVRDNEGVTPLHDAARGWSGETISLLISQGADMESKTDKGNTPVHYAAYFGKLDNLRALINGGASATTKGSVSANALHKAIDNNDVSETTAVQIIDFLLDKGVAINDKDERGFTSLYYAAYKGYEDIARLLITRGAGINEKAYDGWTALHTACKNKRTGMVKLLLDKGAAINDYTNGGATALWIAYNAGAYEITDLLELYGGKVRDADGYLISLSEAKQRVNDAAREQAEREERLRRQADLEERKKKFLPGPYYARFHITTDPGEAEVYGVEANGNRQYWGSTPKPSANSFLSRIFSSASGDPITYTIVVEKRGYKPKKYTFTVRYKYYGDYTDSKETLTNVENIKIILETGSGDED